ncbi:unnamed protein product, partial [Rotaria sordida]
DAQSERQTSIYSPPFYSSPNGYKMRARLYFNGDGNARRTHMSLFFVLIRSLNDPILKFPFNYKVTFCLYDQTSAQRHIIDSFRPDIKSSSFQRPQSDMNIASGIPKFLPLEVIQQEGNPYIRDDTMFIKIMVDFEDLHKTLLSYALSLNPGLPMHIQQAMIKQEAERRSQLRSDELITFDNIPGAGRFQQSLPNGYSGFQWVNANYMNISYNEQVNGWSGYSAALSSGQYVGLNKDGQMLSMIINAARSFTLKSMIVASAWNDNLILEITGKRGGSVFKSKRLTLQLQPQWIEFNWPDLEIVNFSSYGGEPNSDVKGKGTQFAFDNLCVEFSK